MAALWNISARVAVSGESLGEVRVRPDDTVCALRVALACKCASRSGAASCSLRLIIDNPAASIGTGAAATEWQTLEDVGLRDGSMVQVVFCANVLVTTSNDCTARLWEPESGEVLHELMGHFGQVYAGVFSPDGREVVTASEDTTARVWCVDTGMCRLTLAGHRGEVFSAVYSPDGCTIVTASQDHTARLWDANCGDCLNTFAGHAGQIYLAVFAPCGTHALTCSEDKTAKMFDTCTAAVACTFVGHEAEVYRAEFAPNGELAVTASLDCTVKVWKYDGAQCLHTLTHEDRVKFATFSPDSCLIVSTSENGQAMLWNAVDGKLVLILDGHRDDVYTAAFSPDGQRVVTSCEDGHARIWDIPRPMPQLEDGIASTRRACCNTDLMGHSDSVSWACFSPDGRFVVTTSWDETARVWVATTGECLMELEGHAAPLVYGAFNE